MGITTALGIISTPSDALFDGGAASLLGSKYALPLIL
jgi:hypothetical protein